ncbi:hypothetical protein [Antrihabitans sp. YC2-6]|nr:hypothetical protein [Antrihabitans sp. YC2-6]
MTSLDGLRVGRCGGAVVRVDTAGDLAERNQLRPSETKGPHT